MMKRTATILTLCGAITAPHAAAQHALFECQPPNLVGMISGLNNPTSLNIDGDLAYIIEDYTTFTIIDLATPTSPSIISRTQIPIEPCEGVSIIDDTAYLRWQDRRGFTIFNIDDKSDPWFVRYFQNDMDNAIQSQLSPTHILKRDFALNIARPLAPGIDRYSDPDFSFDTNIVAVVDNHAITGNLERYDITEPLDPVLIETFPLGSINGNDTRLEYPRIISSTGSNGVFTFATLTEATDQITGLSIQTPGFTDATMRGDLLFTANSGIDIYAASTDPLPLASLGPDQGVIEAQLVRQLDDHIVALSPDQLAIYEIPTNPIGATRVGSNSTYIDLMGDIAIVGNDRLITFVHSTDIVDISDPQRPLWIAQLDFMNPVAKPQGFAVHQNHVFVAVRNSPLYDFDLSDPANPVLNATYNTASDPKGAPDSRDIEIRENMAYAVDRLSGLTIYQIQSDASLKPTAHLPINDECQRITLLDDLAFICSYNRSYIVQIDDPTNPQLLSVIEGISTDIPRMLTAQREGDLLYTADYIAGYRIFDIADPSNPSEIAAFDIDIITPQGEFHAYVYDLLIEDNLLYLAMSSGGFAVFDNTNPLDPVLISHAPASIPQSGSETRYREFVKRDGMIFIAAGDAGLRILSTTGCTGPCPADLNADGVLNFFDVSLFLVAFANNDPIADLEPDANFNFFDIARFITLYQTGCP